MTRAFSRAEPDLRRQSLIDATQRVLAERGVAGVSVRTICAAAGVSPGLLRHYFAGIDALIADTYVHVAAQATVALAAARDAAGPDPRARLLGYVTGSLRPPISDPSLLATWLGFWELVKSDPEIARLHADIYAASRADVEALLADCGVATEACRAGAIAITALVDGLWLELGLAPDAFGSEAACAIAEQWVNAWLDRQVI
jgi:TetR/AcrR family transcriptional repressor of bet genes